MWPENNKAARMAEFVRNDEKPDPSNPKKTAVYFVMSFRGVECSKRFSDFEGAWPGRGWWWWWRWRWW